MQEEPGLAAIWGIIARSRWIILGCTAAAVATVVVLTRQIDPTYDAEATLRIQEKTPNLPEIYRTLSTGVAGSDLGTEMEVLQSRALVEETSALLGLQVRINKPERVARSLILRDVSVRPSAASAEYRLQRRADGRFDVFEGDSTRRLAESTPAGAVRLPDVAFTLTPQARSYDEIRIGVTSLVSTVSSVQDALEIGQPRRDAYIVTVGYQDTDSSLVRQVPNVLTARYLIRRQSTQSTEARNTVRFLNEQLERVTKELAAAEDSFRTFRERRQVIDPEVESSSQVSRMVSKQSERSALQAERQALEKSLNEIGQEGAARGGTSPYRRLIGLPFLLRNEAASTLLNALVTAENERTALLVRATPRDPDVQALTAKINGIEDQLRAIAFTYLQGLTNQVSALDAELGQFGRQLEVVPGKQLQYARLDRKVKGLEEVYTLLQSRLKEAEIAEAAADASVQVVDTAVTPLDPSGPDVGLNLAAGLASGLLLGLVGAFAREYRDKSVHTRADVLVATGLPVLGLIPHIPRRHGRIALIAERHDHGGPGSRGRLAKGDGRTTQRYTFLGLASPGAPGGSSAPGAGGSAGRETRVSGRLNVAEWGSAVAEAYGVLQTNILFARAEPVKVIMVTSPLAEDGKTTCATNLAITLAMRGFRTVLIDADLRRGTIHEAFGVSRTPGLADVLAGSHTVALAVRTIPVGEHGGSLDFVTTGSLPPNPTGLLSGGELRTVIAEMREQFDAVIIDSPPVNILSDAQLLAVQADGVLLVARSGVTESPALEYAMEQLSRVRASLLGVVLNDIDLRRDAAYDRSYRQYQSQAYLTSSARSR